MKIKKCLPIIFTMIGAVGVVATGYLSARAAHKSIPKETPKEYIKENWKHYILPAATASATITSVILSQALNSKEKAALVAALSVGGIAKLNSYRAEVRKELGEVKEAELYSRSLDHHVLVSEDFLLHPTYEDCTQLFYEDVTGRYFWSNEAKVMEALYHLNRNFSGRGVVKVNEYCELLDLLHTDNGNIIGWDVEGISKWCDTIIWIDFAIRDRDLNGNPYMTEDGHEYLKLIPLFTPDIIGEDYRY